MALINRLTFPSRWLAISGGRVLLWVTVSMTRSLTGKVVSAIVVYADLVVEEVGIQRLTSRP